jgi:hypothetical protein
MSVKIKNIKTGEEGTSGNFNTSSLTEIMVYFEDWMDTDFMSDYYVFIKKTQEWMTFKEAFKYKFLINDNYNTSFFEPENEEDRKRGYTLY